MFFLYSTLPTTPSGTTAGYSIGGSAGDTSYVEYSAQTGGQSFTISGLASGLSLSGGYIVNGTNSVAQFTDEHIFKLISLSAISSIAAGQSVTIKLDGTYYSLALANDVFNVTTGTPNSLSATLVNVDTSYKYTGEYTPAYATSTATNTYIYHADTKHDIFTLYNLIGSPSLGTNVLVSDSVVTFLSDSILPGSGSVTFGTESDAEAYTMSLSSAVNQKSFQFLCSVLYQLLVKVKLEDISKL